MYPELFRDYQRQYRAIIQGSEFRDPAELMISFERGYCDPARQRCTDLDDPKNRFPSKPDYARNIRDFLKTFSEVTTFSAWKEPNYKEQPLRIPVEGRAATPADIALRRAGGGPARAARYTLWATEECEKWVAAAAAERRTVTCTVMAAELAQSRRVASNDIHQIYAEVREKPAQAL